MSVRADHGFETGITTCAGYLSRLITKLNRTGLTAAQRTKFYHQFHGFLQALECMGIPYELHYSWDCNHIKSFEIFGIEYFLRRECEPFNENPSFERDEPRISPNAGNRTLL